jgi:iron-sulfur cluster repair protein YtfE (RIC family)
MTKQPRELDVLDILRTQHDDVFQLIEDLEAGKGDRSEIFDELADKLAAHTAVEEKIFYPAVLDDTTNDMLHEAVEEHLAVKRLLSDMLGLDPENDKEEFDAKLAVLKEDLEHHAREEEEDKLFPFVRKSKSTDERAALANEVLAMFEDMIGTEPRFEIPEETREAAPLPHV